MIKKLVMIMGVLILVSEGSAFDIQNNLNSNSAIFGQTETINKSDKPKFPVDDEIGKIEKRQSSPSYPRLTVIFGMAFGTYNTEKLDQSFVAIVEQFGISSNPKFNKPGGKYTLGLRMFISKTFSLLWDHITSSNPLDENSQGNNYDAGFSSVNLLYTAPLGKKGMIGLTFGVGVASQRIRAIKNYYKPIENSNGTLNNISIDTQSKTTTPFTIMLELPSMAQSRFSLFVSVKFIIGTDFTKELSDTQFPGNQSELKADFPSTIITTGVTYGF